MTAAMGTPPMTPRRRQAPREVRLMPVSAGTPTAASTLLLNEWETHFLPSVFLPEGPEVRTFAQELAAAGMLHIEEFRHGTQIRTTSWVGRITLKGVQITVEPKITGMPLLSLLRYAYGLRNLDLLGLSAYDLSSLSFVDLLIHQLAAEAEELMRRGLRREYLRQDTDLAVPRGRLDIQRYVRQAPTAATTLPCSFYPRTDDTALNQVLLAGLRLASHVTTDPTLRATLATRCRILDEAVTPVRLNEPTLQAARRRMSRLTSAYGPTLTLIELLMTLQGVTLQGEAASITVPGFLFDMNRFFQALLSRFLSQHLTGYDVRDEHRLLGMMAYDPLHNPRKCPAPAPRPDFVVLHKGKMVAVLDAKYRDLWEKALPREMLYQLAIYALSQRQGRTAAILYPTLDEAAREAHVVINDALDGSRTGRVVLRPVNLLRLQQSVDSPHDERLSSTFARQLVFGSSER